MSKLATQTISQHNQLELNAYRISLVTGILLSAVSIISLVATIQTQLYAFLGIIVTALVSIAAFISAYLARKHRSNQGIAILTATILILSLSLPLMAKGQGLSLGIMMAILVSGITTFTLESKWATRATLAAIAVGIIVTLVDLYTPLGFGTPTDPRFTVPIAVLLTVIYTAYLATRFRNFSLRAKLIMAFIVVAVLPLGILGYQTYQNTYSLLTLEKNTNLLNTASLTTDSVDNFIKTQLDTIRTQSQMLDIVDYLKLPKSVRQGSLQEERAIQVLQAFQRSDQVYISSYSLLDNNGIDILDTYTDDIGSNKSSKSYFSEPYTNGVTYVSPVLISETTSERSLYFSAPIRNQQDGAILGVLCTRFSASILQELLNKSLKSSGTSQYAVLVDRQFGIRLAHTKDPALIFTSFGRLPDVLARELQRDGRLAPGNLSDVVVPIPLLFEAIRTLDEPSVFTAPGAAFQGVDMLTAGARLKNQPDWIILAREPVTTALQPVTNQTRETTLLSLLMAGLAAGAAVLVAQFLSAPITALTATAQKVSAGDLSVQANITTQDEIGVLASTFNDMTYQLRQTLSGLEQRVQERTSELETAREQTEKRAQELESISQVSRVIASEQNLDKLLPLITRLISERFNYYHVGIFLLDDSLMYAVLRAANSIGGQRMLEREHKLEVGLAGLVGSVAQKGQTRIALDVDADTTFSKNTDLPDTRSEIALPLKLRGKTIGVLDVQSTQSSAFTDADASTLAILAEQVAIAIDNASLFRETQRALSESQSLYRQFVSQAWEKTVSHEAQIGYLHSMSGGKILDKAINTAEIKQALAKGEMVVAAPKAKQNDESFPTIAIPIKLRNQIIGVVNVRSPQREHSWDKDELAMIQAVSERVAFALDNARLLEDSQRRAARERAIGEISTEIGKATDIDTILRATVEELGKKLKTAEIDIQINNSADI